MNARLLTPAPGELADFASAWRPDWDHDAIAGAIAAVLAGGWEWPRILTETARLMCDDAAVPRDLTQSSRAPADRQRPDPSVARQGAALVREVLAAVRGDAA